MRCWYAFIGPLIWILATGRTLRFPVVQHAIQSLNENRGYGFQHPQPDLATHPAEEKPSLASPQTGSTPLIVSIDTLNNLGLNSDGSLGHQILLELGY